jgi:tetratricopeptide (TPR) repeat protein
MLVASHLEVSHGADEKEQIENRIPTRSHIPVNIEEALRKADTLRQSRHFEESIEVYESILAADPVNARALFHLGILARLMGDHARALRFLERASIVSPSVPEVYHEIGVTRHGLEGAPGAIPFYRKALSLDTSRPDTLYNLGLAHIELAEYEPAIDCFRGALDKDPGFLEARYNLCVCLQESGMFAEAEAGFRHTAELFPEFGEAVFSLACLKLLRGDFKNGLPGYEYRFRKKEPVSERDFPQSRWDLSAPSGRTVLLHAEQGFGDTVQAVRYASLLARRGFRVLVEAPPPLKRLLPGAHGVEIVVARGEPLPDFDYHLPMMSLPLAFGTTLETIPSAAPYIFPDPRLVETWRERMAGHEGFRAGIVWSGRLDHRINRKRSCPLDAFARLGRVPGVVFFSLQTGVDGQDRESSLRMIDCASGFRDFADTAACIANLDLVITIDTSVAHLAGSLGKPVWTLLPFVPDWRWLLERDDSPWYPTMRLFRQKRRGAWDEVLERVACALEALVGRKCHAGISSACSKALETGEDKINTWVRELEQSPGNADLHLGLGAMLHEKGRYEEALLVYDRALSTWPDLGAVYHNRGNTLLQMGRNAEAIACYRKAIERIPGFAEGYVTTATALQAMRKPYEAMAACHRALALDPGCAEAHWNLSLALLQLGEYEEGWKEFEWRWRKRGYTSKPRDFNRPLWDGSPLPGQTLLLHAEQGFGDSIQFARFIPLAAQRCGKVILETPLPLKSLLSGIAGVAGTVASGDPLPDFHAHAPLMSLPHILKIADNVLPCGIPYLSPSPEKMKLWSERFPPVREGFRVGLVWAGRKKPDPNRTCPLSRFAPLAELRGVTFYSLQVGGDEPGALRTEEDLSLVDLTGDITDFSDTAALVSHLDLVISIDTGVAHLSGAMGKETWVILPYAADWRWMLDRGDSPWYPGMRLFRQDIPGAWPGVIARVRDALRELLEKGRGKPFVVQPALKEEPEAAIEHFHRGLELHHSGRPQEAMKRYLAAIAARPSFPEAYHNLGHVLRELGRYEEAGHAFSMAAGMSPHSADILYSLADFKLFREECAEAVRLFRNLVALHPEHSAAWNSLGTALQMLNRYAEARDSYARAIQLAPEDLFARNNMGVLLRVMGEVEASIRCFEDILRMAPGYADAHWNLAVSLLLAGDLRRGWEEYEWRWQKHQPIEKRSFDAPSWNGEDLYGKTILLHAEQGFGDAIQFARYATLLAARGCSVILECQVRELKPLLETAPGVAGVVVRGEPLPSFDRHAPLLSLPLLLRTDLDSVPGRSPYLFPLRERVAEWRRKVAIDAKFRVGLVWQGRNRPDPNRSCPPEFLSVLSGIPNVAYYSLQMGAASGHADLLRETLGMIDLTAGISDFADTAALIACLDMVISIDTSVAHLAGAMGKPVWLLLSAAPDWRWLQGRADSPWYPSMTLFRQERLGEWEGTLAKVASRLRETAPALSERKSVAEYFRMGEELRSGEKWGDALSCYLAVLETEPDNARAFLCAGGCLQFLNRPEEALVWYEKALALEPDNVDVRVNRALALLSAANYRDGWREYEWRKRKVAESFPPGRFLSPEHLPAGLEGKRVLVHVEQGFGDTFQFARYLGLLAREGAEVVVSAQPGLLRLLENTDGVERVVPHGEVLPSFDYQSLLLSLPYVFSQSRPDPFAAGPYIHPDEETIRKWRAMVQRYQGFRAGLVWAGRQMGKSGYRRSVSLETLSPLLQTSGVTFFSLQLGEGAAEALPAPCSSIVDLTDGIEDFSDTAGFVANLDLVISIDTAVAHLAGAMGKEVWLMLLHAPDWRWMPDQEESRWYPGMRLFRQQSPGDWEGVARRIRAALEERAAPRACVAAVESIAEDSRERGAPLYDDALGRDAHPSHFSAGIKAMQNGDFEAAERHFLAAAADDPLSSESFINLGFIADRRERYGEAAYYFRKAAVIAPGSAEAWFNLGFSLKRDNRPEEAVEAFRKAAASRPGFAEAHQNLGLSLQATGRFQEARESFLRALEIDPSYHTARWNLSLLRLLMGEFREGFRDFEARFLKKGPLARLHDDKPLWDGTFASEKTILLHAEQGLGDTIQFVRYAPLIAARGMWVLLEVQSGSLKELVSTIGGVEGVYVRGDSLPSYDFQAPLLSLPGLLGAAPDSVPCRTPYLSALPERLAFWSGKTAGDDNFRIGLVWAGRPEHENDRNRSMRAGDFAPLAALSGVSFYKLQVGSTAEAPGCPFTALLKDFTHEIADFADTAALVSHLDLVISVDTSVAHLAGALARPVWVMLPSVPDWRWMLDREDSPWYPSMRLYRQTRRGVWADVVERVCADILATVQGRRQSKE